MIPAILAIYAVGWFGTAVWLAYENRDQAPTDPDPVALGMLVGLVWPIALPFVLLAWLVSLAAEGIAGLAEKRNR